MPNSRKKITSTQSSAVASDTESNNSVNRPQDSYLRQASMQTSSLLITLLVAVLSFSTGWLANEVKTKSSSTTTVAQQPAVQGEQTTVTQDQVKKLFDSQKLVFGDKDSKVLFVEFSDPSCPYCHVASGFNPELGQQTNLVYDTEGGSYVPPVPKIKELVDAGKAAFAMIYTNGHGAGQRSAQAWYCAQEQGKFWEVHDTLMTDAGYKLINEEVQNDKANDEKLVEYLANVTDADKMRECLASDKYKEQLSKDESVAATFGVSGTPHFMVNTTAYRGAYSYSDMKTTVDAALGE